MHVKEKMIKSASRWLRLSVPVIWALSGTFGCSGGGPPTHNVSGVVTLDGEPIAGAQIGFIPVDDASGTKPANGQTDSHGRYALSTYIKPGQEVLGAMAGNFRVTVTKGLAENRIVDYTDLAERQDNFPFRYADVQSTPFSAAITPNGNNEFNFALQTKE